MLIPRRGSIRSILVVAALSTGAALTRAQSTSPSGPELAAKVDAAVAEIMAKTSVPSASVGIVRDGKVAFTKAYRQGTS